ncbi:MAG: flippase-like domain-containing protein [Bacteroidales bacterium]|nr:flippase-like domain-containing protein [Bacteroidales bacterium]
MKKKAGDILKLVIFLGIGIFFIYWFLLKLDGEQKAAILESFREANYIWVIAAMVVSLLSHWVRALRWRLLYEPMGLFPSQNNTFGSVVVAYMANLAFPRLGEVARCATMRTSEQIPLEKSLGTVVTERVIDVLMFGIVILLGMLIMYSDIKDWLYDSLIEKYESLPSIPLLVAVVIGGVVLLIIAYKLLWKRLLHILFFRKIDDLVRSCITGVSSILHLGGHNTWLFIGYSFAIYLLYILGGLLIIQAFEESAGLGLKAAFAIYLFGSVGMVFSQGGLGVYPVLVQWALSLYAVPLTTGTAAGWMLWGSQQVVVIVVGFAYLIYFAMAKRRQHKLPSDL